MARELLEIDPRELRVPSSRSQGADPGKLQRQIARFGASRAGMPPLCVYRSIDDELVVFNGVTRATRMAKLAPGVLVPIEVVGKIRQAYAKSPTIGELLP